MEPMTRVEIALLAAHVMDKIEEDALSPASGLRIISHPEKPLAILIVRDDEARALAFQMREHLRATRPDLFEERSHHDLLGRAMPLPPELGED